MTCPNCTALALAHRSAQERHAVLMRQASDKMTMQERVITALKTEIKSLRSKQDETEIIVRPGGK
jgi:hypothetical protein